MYLFFFAQLQKLAWLSDECPESAGSLSNKAGEGISSFNQGFPASIMPKP